jgi:hypothetical protein
MKSLSTHITEGLVQPDEIGMPTDGLFRLIQYGTDKSADNKQKLDDKRERERLNRVKLREQEMGKETN